LLRAYNMLWLIGRPMRLTITHLTEVPHEQSRAFEFFFHCAGHQ
jgi:hypothetical protein